MNPKRILVAGGAGLMGSTIVDRLTPDLENRVIVLDNLSRRRLDNLSAAIERDNLTFVDGDIRDREQLRDVVNGIDVVYH